jgi:DNA-binding NarL/FixJ family response regulator
MQPIPSVVSSLAQRQRLIGLLVSNGELEKCIADLLDVSLRTVELEKQRIASCLGIPTPRLAIWAVENRQVLQADVDWVGVSDSIRKLVAPNCPGEWG